MPFIAVCDCHFISILFIIIGHVDMSTEKLFKLLEVMVMYFISNKDKDSHILLTQVSGLKLHLYMLVLVSWQFEAESRCSSKSVHILQLEIYNIYFLYKHYKDPTTAPPFCLKCELSAFCICL